MLKVGMAYKHENCTDAAIVVLARVPSRFPRRHFADYRVWWVNVTSPRRYIMETDDISIKLNDLHKWKPLEV